MAAGAIRGSRIGSGPMGEAERGEAAPRQFVTFFCINNHTTELQFAIEAEVPESWDCPRCGMPASVDSDNRPTAKKIEPSVLLNTRLAPNMVPLVRQVQIATDLANRGAARLAGLEPPAYQDNEMTIEQLKARIRASNLRAETAVLLVDFALSRPIFSVKQVRRQLGVTYARANKLVGQLVELGILGQYDDREYDRRFASLDVLAVLLRPAG